MSYPVRAEGLGKYDNQCTRRKTMDPHQQYSLKNWPCVISCPRGGVGKYVYIFEEFKVIYCYLCFTWFFVRSVNTWKNFKKKNNTHSFFWRRFNFLKLEENTLFLSNSQVFLLAQAAAAVEYTDCISGEE